MFSCLSSLTLQGNAWGLITGKDGYGFPTGIEWIPPEMVIVEQEVSQPLNPLATNVYAYGRRMKWYGPDTELFHVKGFALPGRLEGISPLMAFAVKAMMQTRSAPLSASQARIRRVASSPSMTGICTSIRMRS